MSSRSDAKILYAYLPAAFLYHDLSFGFVSDPAADFPAEIPLNWTERGDAVLKMSCGAAVLWTPFFLLAHAAARCLSVPANGYTWPYHYAIDLAAIVYAVAGLVLLRGVLRRHFADGVVALTLVAVFAGTNLFYYTTFESGMTHAYSFFLFALFLRLTVAWHANPRWATTLALGGVLGLVVLVRPTNGVVVLAFLLYRDATLPRWRDKLDLLARQWLPLFAALGMSFTVLPPQLAYWKYSTGSWVYYSYQDEGAFFFTRPRIIDGLISYRKGLFVYTPILSLAFAGMLLLPRRLREWSWAVAMFTAVDLYVVFSWWCWWYGASFGMRALIEAYRDLGHSHGRDAGMAAVRRASRYGRDARGDRDPRLPQLLSDRTVLARHHSLGRDDPRRVLVRLSPRACAGEFRGPSKPTRRRSSPSRRA